MVRITVMENAFGRNLYIQGVLVSGIPTHGDEILLGTFELPMEKVVEALATSVDGKTPRHKRVIRWGSETTRADNEGAASTYRFDTKVEADAFMYGVQEAIGWFDFEEESEACEECGETYPEGWEKLEGYFHKESCSLHDA